MKLPGEIIDHHYPLLVVFMTLTNQEGWFADWGFPVPIRGSLVSRGKGLVQCRSQSLALRIPKTD